MRRFLQFMFLLSATLILCPHPVQAQISEIDAAKCTGASSCTTGSATGDLMTAMAGRDGSATAPTNAAWTTVITGSINGTSTADSSARLFCKVAAGANEATGTFTNAGAIAVHVYRGVSTTTAACASYVISTSSQVFTTPINTTSTTETFNTRTNTASTSWDVGFGYAPAATAGMGTAPTGMTNRTIRGTILGGHDTNGTTSAFSTANVTITTASRIITIVAEIALPTCSNTVYGAYTCRQTCTNTAFTSVTVTCALPQNLTAGSTLYYMGLSYSSQASFTLSGCSLSPSDLDGVVTGGSGWFAHGWAANSGTGACTVTLTVPNSATVQIYIVEISAPTQTVDGHVLTYAGSVTTGNPISPAAITTSVDGDFVIEGVWDITGSAVIFTAGGAGTILSQASAVGALQGQVQASHGSITPSMTANATHNFAATSFALEPSGGAPPACTPSLALLGVGRCG